MNGALWSSAESIGRVVLLCVLAYGTLVMMLRIGGKRTTSKLNAYDWVVTVALGSMLGATVLTDAVPLLEGVAAFATLIALQWSLSWLTTRSKLVHRIVKSEPALLYWQGEFLQDRMRAERVAEDEILAAVRESGLGSLDDIEAVVLETNAEFSVVRRLPGDAGRAPLDPLEVPEPRHEDGGTE